MSVEHLNARNPITRDLVYVDHEVMTKVVLSAVKNERIFLHGNPNPMFLLFDWRTGYKMIKVVIEGVFLLQIIHYHCI